MFPSLDGEKLRSSVRDLFWELPGSKHCCFSTQGQDDGAQGRLFSPFIYKT